MKFVVDLLSMKFVVDLLSMKFVVDLLSMKFVVDLRFFEFDTDFVGNHCHFFYILQGSNRSVTPYLLLTFSLQYSVIVTAVSAHQFEPPISVLQTEDCSIPAVCLSVLSIPHRNDS